MIILLFTITIFATIICFFIYSQGTEVERIIVVSEAFPNNTEIKIAHLSDLHIPRTGLSYKKIENILKHENPDYIFLTGDNHDHHTTAKNSDMSVLLEKLLRVAPVYAVLGNHELRIRDNDFIFEEFEKHGVRLLYNSTDIINHNGCDIAVLGTAPKPEGFYKGQFKNTCKTESSPKILITHFPQYINEYTDKTNPLFPNIIFAGHAHGGQIRLPFLKGLYAPGQGFFPKYTSGLYTISSDQYMIVSRGMKNGILPPKLNNRCHIPIVVIKEKTEDGKPDN